MGRPKDLAGQRFTRLVVISLIPGHTKKKYSKWLCQCDCGAITIVPSNSLASGHTKSCGCFSAEETGKRSFKHGHSMKDNATEYTAWRNMLKRCSNPKHPNYSRYGGRGISVCERWKTSFENFLADMGMKPQSAVRLTIEREDNDGNYEPGNCKWATYKEQNNNKRPRKRRTEEIQL